MAYLGLDEQIQEVRAKDPRYGRDAYFFILEALDYTIASLGRYQKDGLERHVGSEELLLGIQEFAIQRFGPLAERVFSHWGIRESVDLGDIVFNLVECGLLNSRPEETREQFSRGMEFSDAFSAQAGTLVDWEDLYWN